MRKESKIKKKKWAKPKLIVLVRGYREEDVLIACKYGGSYFGSNQKIANCQGQACVLPCDALTVS